MKFINDRKSQKLREVIVAFYYGAEAIGTNMPLDILSINLYSVLGDTRRISYFMSKLKVQDINGRA